jgi:spermidine/putrescine-binding protein
MVQTLGRRSFIVSAASLPLLLSASARAQGQSITILIWGTTWQLVMKGIAEKFTAATGIAVNLVTQTTGGESLVKLQAMKADPTVDVWFTTSSVAERAVKDADLFADLPEALIPNLKNVYPDAVKPRWVGAYAYPLGIVYRPDLVKQPITSWGDLWSSRFVNQIGVPAPSSYQARMLLLATLLGGGSIDNVEPGFAKLKELSKNVAFWYTSDAQARKALAQGEISVLIAPPSGAKTVRNQGVEVTMISPKPAPVLYDVMTLVKTKRQDLGARFIDFVLSTDSQVQIATDMENKPVNRFAPISDRLKAELPNDGDTVAFDEDVVNSRIDAWSDRFKQVVAQ